MTYTRKYPLYSLCGLNCGLCPNYHSTGAFICPGCGGENFYGVHPKCSIITCAIKKGVEFCYECIDYPCDRYTHLDDEFIYDSFITYQNVKSDVDKVKRIGIENYCEEQREKIELLKYLLEHYNVGRQKTFFTIAVNLLEIEDIKTTIAEIENKIYADMNIREASKVSVEEFKKIASGKSIEIKLHKKK